MAGPVESQAETTKKQLSDFEKILDEYIGKIGLGDIKYQPVEVQKILDMSYEDITRLTEDECAAHYFVLSKFAFYIRKEQNRQNVRVNWAKTKLAGIFAKEGSKYGDSYVKYEVKLGGLCNENSTAKILSDIILYAGARSTELEQLAEHINTISKSLNDNRQTKRKYGNATRND